VLENVLLKVSTSLLEGTIEGGLQVSSGGGATGDEESRALSNKGGSLEREGGGAYESVRRIK
jgi:hypothetical protein